MSVALLFVACTVGFGAVIAVVALLVAHEREFAALVAEDKRLRDRLQSASIIIAELVELPNASAISLAQAWLKEEPPHAPMPLAAMATRDRAQVDRRR